MYTQTDTVSVICFFLFHTCKSKVVSQLDNVQLFFSSYDLCDLLDWFRRVPGECPWQLTNSNVPCMCPFDNTTYTLQPYPFSVPQVSAMWEWIAAVSTTVYNLDHESTARILLSLSQLVCFFFHCFFIYYYKFFRYYHYYTRIYD